MLEAIDTESQDGSLRSELGRNRNAKKQTREKPTAFWNKFVRLTFSPDLVTADTQLCPSRVLGTHLPELEGRGLPEAQGPEPWALRGTEPATGARTHTPGGCHSTPQLPSLAGSGLHDVLWDWNSFFFSVAL